MTTTNGWVRTMSLMDVAEEFSRFLEQNCDWSLDDFGGDYPWDSDVPAREDWEKSVQDFNRHLATLCD